MIASTTGILMRVSDKDQKHASQEFAIRAWLRAQNLDPEQCKWYVEKETGRKVTRKELERLNRDVFDGRIKTIVVYKIDRIARKMFEGLQVLHGWTDKGVRFVSTSEAVDLDGIMGKMTAALLFGFAEIEWGTRRDRQRDGIADFKAKGGAYKGRKPGSTKKPPARIRELRDKGLRAAEIAEALGISVRTVWRHLGESGAEAGAGAAAVGEEQIADARPEQ